MPKIAAALPTNDSNTLLSGIFTDTEASDNVIWRVSENAWQARDGMDLRVIEILRLIR